VFPFIAGYEAGAKKADPGITTLRGYANDFVNPAKCKAVARSQIAEGAGVVFDVAGLCGVGALQAAKAEHVWGIGVEVDQSFLGPQILTSVLKGPQGQDVFQTIKALVQGRLLARGASSNRCGGVADRAGARLDPFTGRGYGQRVCVPTQT
jgi:basic membrane protein A